MKRWLSYFELRALENNQYLFLHCRPPKLNNAIQTGNAAQSRRRLGAVPVWECALSYSGAITGSEPFQGRSPAELMLIKTNALQITCFPKKLPRAVVVIVVHPSANEA